MMKMERVKLGDISKLINGDRGKNYPSQADITDDGEIPFINAGHLNGGSIDFSEMNYISQDKYDKLNSGKFQKGDILYCLRGSLGKKAIVNNDINGAIASSLVIIRPDPEKVSGEYLMLALDSPAIKEQLVKANNGSSQPNLSAASVREYEVELPEFSIQKEVVEKLIKVRSIIDNRRQELQLLNDLIKARFVEMFGDPVSNPYGYDKVALSDLADIKIGPFGSLLHKDDYIVGGHPLLNPSHIVDGKISPDNKLTISNEKYEELSAYHLKTGDVVMGRRGEMGRCAIVPEEGFLCGTGSILIRTKGEVTADYIQKIISFPSFKKTIEDMAVGQTMPNLNVPIVSSFQIIKPPRKVQDRYYAFAEQVDKSKVVVQKALDETQILFNSLMQQYFG